MKNDSPGRSWGALGGTFARYWGSRGEVLDDLGGSWADLGSLWEALGAPWAVLIRSWVALLGSWIALGHASSSKTLFFTTLEMWFFTTPEMWFTNRNMRFRKIPEPQYADVPK